MVLTLKANNSNIIINKINTFPNQKRAIKKDTPAKFANSYSRPCSKNDIIGFWKVEKWTPFFHIPAKDWNKPSFMKFQWYEFYTTNQKSTTGAIKTTGGIKSLASQKTIPIPEVKRKILNSKSNLTFQFEQDGIILVSSNIKKAKKERWRITISMKEIKDKSLNINVAKGDIFMSLLSEHNEVLYIRQLRKIAISEKK